MNCCALLRKKLQFAGEIDRRLTGSLFLFAHGSVAVLGPALFKCVKNCIFPSHAKWSGENSNRKWASLGGLLWLTVRGGGGGVDGRRKESREEKEVK